MKRVLSFILVLSMILGSIGMTFAAPTDNATYAEEAVAKLVELGFVEGDEGGLRLDDTITRAEVAVLAARMAGLEEIAKSSNYQGVFSDVSPTTWANPVMNGAINVAVGQGFVKGYPDGTYLPNNDVTNAEIITLMVRLAVSEDEIAKLDKGVWPAAYITKAAELGLLEGTNINNYQDAATRETVFVLGYNANASRVEEDLEVVKAIVLENDRVESIGKGEVVVEIIKEVQRASFTEESRKKEGDQLRLTVPAELGDVEDLLGKVVDLVSDKNGLVNIVVDESYQVVTGAITAEKNRLTIGTKGYTVSLDERYKDNDERVFRTYFNNKPYKYEDFYKGLVEKGARAAEEFKADYARVTIKNGKVLFVDSFKFEDIAPVKEVKEDGAEVFVYNDARDGGVKKFELKANTQVVAVEKGVFSKATREDIEVNDVVHYYGNGFIVRKDAIVNGTFEKVSEDNKGNIFVHVDGKEYKVLTAANKQPVYSYDSGDFYTLNASAADKVLKEFRGEKVTVLQDISGNLQYVGSEIELGEFVGIVTRVVGKEIRVLKADGKTADYTATLNTKFVTGTGHQSLEKLNAGDLVYLSVDGDKIEKVTELVKDYKVGTTDVGTAGKQTVNFFDAKDIKLDAAVATGDNTTDFRLLSDTTIFVTLRNSDGKVTGYEVRTAKDVKDAFEKNQKDGKEVKAYVISGERFVRVVDPRRDVYTNRKTEAHTIVFTELEIKAELDTKIVEFNGFADRQEREMNVIYADGSKETLPVDRNLIMPAGLKGGDILEIKVTKDDKKEIKEVSRLIQAANKDDIFAVETIDRQGNLTLRDVSGAKKTFYVETKTAVFGNLGNAERVSYVPDGNTKYLKAVLVRAKNERVTGNFDGIFAGVDGTVTRVIEVATSSTTNRIILEITDGLKVTEHEVVGLALTFINDIGTANLVDADIKMIIENNKIVGFEHIKFNKDITADNGDFTIPKAFGGLVLSGAKKITGDITVNADNVKMKDITVTGTVTLANGINNFTAEGTNFDNLTINGGGSNSIHLTRATIKDIVVNKAGVRVELVNTEVTNKIEIKTAAKLEIKGTSKVKDLEVNASNVELVQDSKAEVTNITGSKAGEMKYTPAVDAKNSSVTKAVYDSAKGEFSVEFEVKDQVKKAIKDIRKADVKVEVKDVVIDMSKAEFANVKDNDDKVVDGKYVVTFKKTEKIDETGNVKVTVKDVVFEVKVIQPKQ